MSSVNHFWNVSIAAALALCTTGVLDSTAAAQDAKGADGATLGSQYVPVDGVAAGKLNPAKLMSCKTLELYPIEVAEAWSLDNVGISPSDCESIKVVVASPGPSGPMVAAIVKLKKPFAIEDLHPQIVRANAPLDVDGYACLPINGPPGAVIHQLDPSTIILSSQNYLETVLKVAQGNDSGPLALLADEVQHDGQLTVVLGIEPVRPMLNGLMQTMVDQIPPPFVPFAELPNLLDAVIMQVDLEDEQEGIRLTLLAIDDASADQLEVLIEDAMNMARQMGLAQMERNLRGEGPVPEATQAYANRIADRIIGLLKPKRNGRKLVLTASPGQGLASQATLAALLLPAIRSARVAAVRVGGQNNLKMIGLAMHNYHDVYRKLPARASRDADNQPLLSWRVHVLPFIEEAALYEQFHLDEPWDSEHNIKLLEMMPDVYRNDAIRTEAGKTVYQVPSGEETMFPLEGETRFRDISDGLSNTAMVITTDAENAIEWTRPDDLEIDMDNPLQSIGFVNDTAAILMGDGSVRQIPEQIGADTFRKLLTRSSAD